MTGRDLVNMIEENDAFDLDVVVFEAGGLLKDADRVTVAPICCGSNEEFALVIE